MLKKKKKLLWITNKGKNEVMKFAYKCACWDEKNFLSESNCMDQKSENGFT